MQRVCIMRAEHPAPPNVLANPGPNPYPMGLSGDDERWRWVVCDLHSRWLEAGHVEALHVLMPDGEALPLDVRPRATLKTAKGQTTVRC